MPMRGLEQAVTQIQTIAIVGAGQMGQGIAQTASAAGYRVLLADVEHRRAVAGKEALAKVLQRLVDKGKLANDDKAQLLARISPVGGLDELGGAEMVIEAVSEVAAVKKKVFQELDRACAPGVILASNTSSLGIGTLGRVTGRPELVVGMHFMNPVPLMKLVEGIRGERTADVTLQVVRQVAESMGKVFVESQDSPGFIVNRILLPMINEAFRALEQGVASAEDIDEGMRLGTHQPMGPLRLADLIGLDTCCAILEVMAEGLATDKYQPVALLKRYVEEGRLGKKVGLGVYGY